MSGARPAPAFRVTPGVTLVELLAVVAIISLLAAMGAGIYIRTSGQMKEEASVASLDALVRQVRNSVLSSGAPAYVELDTAHNPPRAIPWTFRTVGQWHFEEEFGDFKGARKHNAHNLGCVKDEGKIGRGISCGKVDASGSSYEYTGYVEVETDSDFDLEDGGYLEAYVYPAVLAPFEMVIFKKKDCYSFCIGKRGALVGRAGDKTLEVDPNAYRLPARRWSKVAFSFDKRASRILVDDFVVASGPGMTPKVNDESLQISDDQLPLIGKIDEAKVLEAIRGSAVELPPGTTLTHNVDPWGAVYFAPDGTLDVRYHSGPVKLDVQKGTKRRSILISMLGSTHKGDVEDVRPKEEAEDPVTGPSAPLKGKPATKPLLPQLPGPKTKLPSSDDVKPPDDPTTLVTPDKPMENLPAPVTPENPPAEMKEGQDEKKAEEKP